MADATTAAATTQNPYLGQENPYLQNVIDLSSRDLVNNYNRSVAPAQNTAAIRSGSFGNSALGELAQADQNQLQQNLGDLSSKLRFNDYGQQQGMYQWQQQFDQGNKQFDQTFDRNVFNDAYTQQMGYLNAGLGLVGGLQNSNANDLTNATNQQNAPLQYWQQFANGAGGIGNGYGTTTGTQGTTSNPLGQALGGAQLGGAVQNFGNQQGWWGNNSGSGSSGTGTNYSIGSSSLPNWWQS